MGEGGVPGPDEIGKILFLVRSLTVGGSERQLVVLARALFARGYDVEVAVFYGGGPFEPELRAAGVPVHDLRKQSRWDLLAFGARLAALLRRLRPAILHGYLVESNLLALAARVAAPGTRVVWGVRASYMDLSQYTRLAGVAFDVSRRAAHLADLTIYNSQAGFDYHVAQGYPARRGAVVPNGIDTDAFAPRPEARAAVRAAWGIGDHEALIGIPGRVDPMKGHDAFLRAAALLLRRRAGVRFVVVGEGNDDFVAGLRRAAEAEGIAQWVVWAGRRADMPAVYAALDLATSASLGEGFPNVVGEAMACGVPCVVTDVGDSAAIVADTGIAVPPRDPAALCDAWEAMLSHPAEERERLRSAARERIVRNFSVAALAERTVTTLVERLPARAAIRRSARR